MEKRHRDHISTSGCNSSAVGPAIEKVNGDKNGINELLKL